MSKIALNSNASGTGVFTIESPNSDTDRTLTLPDESGTIVSENASGDVAVAGDITSNGNAVITTQSPQLGRRNLIINGAMQVAQRGTSAAISGGKDYSSLDRFFEDNTLLDEYVGTISQVSDAPSGFSSSLKITTTTAESSIASDEYFYVAQAIEAQNLQHLKYGQSDANQLTLSFWAKSSVTGTYGVNCYSQDGSRIFTSTYSINTADTWEYKTISIVGDISGTINNDAGSGLQICWHLAAGSNFTGTDRTSWGAYEIASWAYGHAQNGVITTLNATWQITGVQLEVGDTATPFEHRSFGEELLLCQRYYEKSFAYATTPVQGLSDPVDLYGFIGVTAYSTINGRTRQYTFVVEKRAAPSITIYRSTNTATDGRFSYYSGGWQTPVNVTAYASSKHCAFDVTASYSAYATYLISGGFAADAEL